MQININLEQLLAFLNKVYVWTPKDSYIRGEVQNFINQLKQHQPK
jgi:3-methyladenine DNA glycosylase AlkC